MSTIVDKKSITAPRVVPNVPSTQDPILLRGRLVHSIIESVNDNAAKVAPPRVAGADTETDSTYQAAKSIAIGTSAEVGAINDTETTPGETPMVGGQTWTETSRTSTTVRVENPDDADQYVDVERPSSVNFVNTTTGETATFVFAN